MTKNNYKTQGGMTYRVIEQIGEDGVRLDYEFDGTTRTVTADNRTDGAKKIDTSVNKMRAKMAEEEAEEERQRVARRNAIYGGRR